MNTVPSPAVLLIVFNRPDLLRVTIKALEEIKPSLVFVAADGPRNNVISDGIRCEEVRKLISEIDMGCEVRTNFMKANRGCDVFVPEAISWAFDNCNSLIVLEDDCVPTVDFFQLCEDLLQKYERETMISSIVGNNLGISNLFRTNSSYLFSSYSLIWGWATWKNRWDEFKKFDFANAILDSSQFSTEIEFLFWQRLLIRKQLELIPWDYSWMLFNMLTRRLSVIPNVNLVGNIGLGPDATHPFFGKAPTRYIQTFPLAFPLVHPRLIATDMGLDEAIGYEAFGGTDLRRLKLANRRIKGRAQVD